MVTPADGEAQPSYQMAYAVHTRTCTYLLDEHGVCRWVVSPRGVVPGHVRQCIGAQFVASLDTRVDGGLLGDLAAGAMALFVRALDDRLILLRTGEVLGVDDRRGQGDGGQTGADASRFAVVDDRIEEYGKRQGVPMAPSFGKVEHNGEERTITVATNIPLPGPRSR